MKSIRLGCMLSAVMSAALLISEAYALAGFPNSQTSANKSTATQGDDSCGLRQFPAQRRQTDLTISIFSLVIGKHMFVGSPNA